MQAIIVYYSLTGQTAQAAKYIAKGLEAENVDVVISLNAHKATADDLRNKDIVVIGTPVHVGAPAMELRRFLNKLPEDALSGKKVAIFSTFLFWGSDTALNTVEEILRDKGASGDILRMARRTSILRNIWNALTGSTKDEEAWIAFGKLIATS